MTQVETKFLQVAFDVKAEGDKGEFIGYGAVFGNIDSHRDIIVSGAFTKSLHEHKHIPILWQHDSREPIGLFVELSEDQKGLLVKGNVNMETQRGREAFALLKQGAIKGLSIGFITMESDFDEDRNVRLLKELHLMEISLVTFPSNVEAEVVGVKNKGDMTVRQFENTLRDLGFSQKGATIISSKGYKAFQEQRDVDDGEVKETGGKDRTGLLEALNKFKTN